MPPFYHKLCLLLPSSVPQQHCEWFPQQLWLEQLSCWWKPSLCPSSCPLSMHGAQILYQAQNYSEATHEQQEHCLCEIISTLLPQLKLSGSQGSPPLCQGLPQCQTKIYHNTTHINHSTPWIPGIIPTGVGMTQYLGCRAPSPPRGLRIRIGDVVCSSQFLKSQYKTLWKPKVL